jgi:hypothetical protein
MGSSWGKHPFQTAQVSTPCRCARYFCRVLTASSCGRISDSNRAADSRMDETTPGAKAKAAIAGRQRPSAASRAVRAPSLKSQASMSQPRRAARARIGAEVASVGTVVRVFHRTSSAAPAPRL